MVKVDDTKNDVRSMPQALNYAVGGRVAFCIGATAALMLGLGGWAATAEISGAVVTQGVVTVEGNAKKIQHREGGIVAAIKVQNGSRISQGDVLVVLDDTQARAELGVLKSQLIEYRTRHARLQAERDFSKSVAFPSDLSANPEATAVLEGERRLFSEARQARESQKEQLELRISQLQQEKSGVDAQAAAKKRELALIEQELAGVRDLYDRKLTPATRVYAMDREQTRLSGEHASLTAQSARISGQISEIRLQTLNLDQQTRADAQRESRNAEARIAELREREIAIVDRLSRMEVRAPVGGIVYELNVHTVGGVVTPAESMMTIVPEGRELGIELRVSPAEIDQLHPGQQVRLRFTAFNQRTTPERTGTISHISPDVSHDARSRTDYYTARVALIESDTMDVGGVPVVPGMPVEAFITTGTRTALSYFVKPISDQLQRALREE